MDAEHETLPGATVHISELNKGLVTNTDGSFILTGMCEGTYTLTISFVGYKTHTQKVRLRRSESVHIDLEVDETMLNEVVVQDHYDHLSRSQTTTTLSGSALEAARGKSLGAALKSIAGLSSIQSGPAISKPVIHGVHSQRILILNNGIRHEGQQWGAEHAPEIDPLLAGNLVVVKDASAIKYGTDALGGVIIVNPAELPQEPGIGGTLHSGIHTNGRGGSVGGILEGASTQVKGLSWRTHGSLKKSGDYHTPDYSLTNTGFRENNFSVATRYHPKETSGIEFFYSRFDAETGLLKGASVSTLEDLRVAYDAAMPRYTRAFGYSLESPRQTVTHNLAKAVGHFHRGGNTLSFQYAWQQNHRQEFQLRRAALLNTPTLHLKLSTHTFDVEWEQEKEEDQQRCIGINLLVQQNRNVPGIETIPFVPNFSNYSGGVYGIQKFQVHQWQTETGVRFDYRYYTVAGRDYSNSVFTSSWVFANVSATLGATRNLGKYSRFISGLSTAWRPPHVAELYSIGTHQSAVAVESGLMLDENSRVRSPEEVDFKTEKAVKWVSTYRLSNAHTQIELTGYINYIFNYVYLKPEGATASYPYFHYRQTNGLFRGIDLQGEHSFNDVLSLKVSGAWLQASDVRNDDYFIYIPSNRGTTTLRYQRDLSPHATEFFIEAGVQFVAQQQRAPRVITIAEIIDAAENNVDLFANDDRAFDYTAAPSAYWLFQASTGISIRVRNQRINVTLTGENLANTRYREYTNRLRYFANETGRNGTMAITYHF